MSKFQTGCRYCKTRNIEKSAAKGARPSSPGRRSSERHAVRPRFVRNRSKERHPCRKGGGVALFIHGTAEVRALWCAVTIVSGTKRSRQDSRYGCSMHASRGSQVCGNKLLMPRRVLEAQLLAGLQMNVLRREVIDYTLRRFEDALIRMAQRKDRENARSNDVKLLTAKKAKIEEGIENCTNAIAEGQPSKFLIAKLVALERELQSVVACLRGARTDAIETQFRDTRKFVELRLKDFWKLLNAEPRLARAAIENHVQKIELTPGGKTYVASGSWDLLGGGPGAVSMVPGDGIATVVHMRLASPQPHERRRFHPRLLQTLDLPELDDGEIDPVEQDSAAA
jgi:hypothetical protein